MDLFSKIMITEVLLLIMGLGLLHVLVNVLVPLTKRAKDIINISIALTTIGLFLVSASIPTTILITIWVM